MSLRLKAGLCGAIGILVLGAFGCDRSTSRSTAHADIPAISKLPVHFVERTFDPEAPPSDLPPMTPGENAECDSNFLSNASASGETRQIDSSHGVLTVTQVRMTLQLDITIWLPYGATPRVTEHEAGHRQISEYYYQSAEKVAERIGGSYTGKQIEITGVDLNAEAGRALQQIASEITNDYSKQIDSEPTQLLYDSITDHSRNDVKPQDAVAHALKNAAIEADPRPNQL